MKSTENFPKIAVGSIVTLAFGLLHSASSFAAPTSAVKKNNENNADRPNILFIFTDDQRYDSVAALGNKDIYTPNLDSLVNHGVTFVNTYLQGANTAGTSVPSRCQLLTGRGVFNIPDGWGRPFPDSMTTFATAFSRAGYYTFTTGKETNGIESSMRGFKDGAKLFDLGQGHYHPHYKLPVQDFRKDGKYGVEHMYYVGENNKGRYPVLKYDKPDMINSFEGTHDAKIFGKACADFIKNYDKKEPFLIYLAFHAPHDPRQAPRNYKDMYPVEDIHLYPNFRTMPIFDNGQTMTRDELLAPYPRTVENTKEQISDYYAFISLIDAELGKILKVLRERGFDKKTIIVFSSDSGLGLGSHGLFGKQSLYDDGSIHVPFVLCGPNIPENQKRKDLCYTFDIYPTLCDLTNIPIPKSVLGKSVAASIKHETAKPKRKELFFGYEDLARSVRDERFKLIESCVHGVRTTQLFDLIEDPYEIHNLFNEKEYANVLAHLRKRLEANKVNDASWGDNFWKTYFETPAPKNVRKIPGKTL